MSAKSATSRRFLLLTAIAISSSAAVLSGCGDDDTNDPSTGSLEVAVTPVDVPVIAGSSATTTVNITRGGTFAGPVTLATSGAPGTFDVELTPGQLDAATTSATLAIAVEAGVAPGTYPVTISAAGNGVTTRSTTINVVVAAAPPG